MATLPQWIEARVIQKIATEAEWNAITLVPYKGEVCLVGDSGGKVVNIKVGDGVNTFPNLYYMFDSIQQNASFVPTIGNTLPAPSVNPAFTILGDGDYGTIPADEGNMRIANWDGSVWTVASTVAMPEVEGTGTLEAELIPKGKAVQGYVNKVALDVLSLNVDDIDTSVIKPYDKSDISFTNNMNNAGTYFDRINAKNITKFFIKASISGTVAVKFLTISSNKGTVVYSTNVECVTGVNEFSVEDLSLPNVVRELEEFYVGVTPLVDGALMFSNEVAGELSVATGASLNITDTAYTGCTWFEANDSSSFVLTKYPQTQQLLDNTINLISDFTSEAIPEDRTGLNMPSSGNISAVYGESEIYSNLGRKLNKLNIFARGEGDVHVYYVHIGELSHEVKYQTQVSCFVGLNEFSVNDLGGAEFLETSEDIHIMCGNAQTQTLNPIHGGESYSEVRPWYTLIRDTNALSIATSDRRFSFWIDIEVMDNKLVEEVLRLRTIVDNQPEPDVAHIYDYKDNYPVLPSDIFVDSQSATPLYKNSVFTKFTDALLAGLKLNSKNKVIDVLDPTYIQHDDVGTTGRFIVDKQTEPNTLLYKDVRIHKFSSSDRTGTVKWMSLGDSLTEGGTGNFNSSPLYLVTKELQTLGIAVDGIGTIQRTFGDVTGRYEGHGGWRYRTFVGLESRFSGYNVVIPPPTTNHWVEGVDGNILEIKSNNPFLYEATPQDLIDYPEWCFHFVTGATTNNVSYSQNPSLGTYYIFSPERYFAERGIEIPDVVSIALGTNEWYLGGYSGWDLDLILSCAEWMIDRFLQALPSMSKLLVITCNNIPLTRETEWQTKASVLTSAMIKMIDAKKPTNSNLYGLSIYAHGSRQLAYNNITSSSNLDAYNDVKLGVIDSDVHMLNVNDQSRFDYVDSLKNAVLYLMD